MAKIYICSHRVLVSTHHNSTLPKWHLEHDALKRMGKLFRLRRDVNLVRNVLDTPELFWRLRDAVKGIMFPPHPSHSILMPYTGRLSL
jgi:hypothetical protein